MVRRIIAGLVLVLMVYLGWVWYKGRSEKANLDSGEFTCQGCLEGDAKARFLKENAGEAANGTSERKSTSASIAAQQATPGTSPAAPVAVVPVIVPPTTTSSTGTSSMVMPQNDNTAPPAESRSTVAPAPTNISQSYSGSMGSPPAADSVSPNPQNDAHFRGAGSFEWYRQGNITWRVDTTNGRSCIVYATMEEWRKQIVMSHGCGHNV